jgi:pimeloyl-ACP methyl ester carboxylesterase
VNNYRTFEVAVPGGTLRGGIWGSSGPAVLCAHGITGNHVSFEALGEQLGDFARVIAPDHRGRGRSRDITGPWGMKQHASDLMAVLDHLGIRRADVVVGHSMGGFTAAVTAARYPERIGGIVMVDGGIPVLRMPFVTKLPFSELIVEYLIKRVIGPSLTRLEMSFASRDAYRQFWRGHPALIGNWSEYVEHYLDYDLMGEPPSLRPTTRKDAMMRDVFTQLEEDLIPRSLKQLRQPVRFLRAEHGVMNDKPLYDAQRLAKQSTVIRQFVSRSLPGINHFTILLSERGAREIAAEVRALLDSTRPGWDA